MLILIGDADDWKGKNGQLISQLFAVGTEISAKEQLIEKARLMEQPDGGEPCADHYGSLYIAASIEDNFHAGFIWSQ